MKMFVTAVAFAVVAPLAVAGPAHAQGAVQPGTEFPAAPMSRGGLSLLAPSQIIAPAPPPSPVVTPVPEPAPKVRRKHRKS